MKDQAPKCSLKSMKHSWLLLESIKFLSLFIVIFIPSIGYEIINYLIFIWLLFLVYSLYRTILVFRKLIDRSVFEDNERLRVVFCKARNNVLMIMISDLLPFLIFPQTLLRWLYLKKERIFFRSFQDHN